MLIVNFNSLNGRMYRLYFVQKKNGQWLSAVCLILDYLTW